MSLFADVNYHLSLSLPQELRTHLTHVLNTNGATVVSLEDATHIITNSHQFERWQTVSDGVFIVTDKWVMQSVQMNKLQPPQYYSADPALIFSGVIACATELSLADVEVLSAGIAALGGQWRTSLTRDVTHLFAVSPGSKKYDTALHFQSVTRVKVVLPHWFDDAVRLGTGTLPTVEYEWPEPRILRTAQETEGEDFKKPKMAAAKKVLLKTAAWTPDQLISTGGTKPRDIWQKQKILLSASLELTRGRRDAVESGIKRANGIVVEYDPEDDDDDDEARKVTNADILITRYRSGAAYIKAVKLNKTIGTLPWLFCVESTGVFSRPMDQLLHYPIPKRPIDGFSAHEITVTNYTGESREYLKKLIMAMGAKFTPSMSRCNTVLIAAHVAGNKATKARNWSIPIVNHTWLEDCFVQWRNLTVGLEKYIVFPPGVDFAQMLGERGVGRAVVDEAELELIGNADEEVPVVSERSRADKVKVPVDTGTNGRPKRTIEKDRAKSDDNTGDIRQKRKAQSKSPSKPLRGILHSDNEEDLTRAERNVRASNKSPSPKKRLRSPESSADEESELNLRPTRKQNRRRKSPSEPEIVSSPDHRKKGKQAMASDNRKSTKYKRALDSSDDERPTSPIKTPLKYSSIAKARAKAKDLSTPSDSDVDLPPLPLVLMRSPPKATSSTGKPKAKVVEEVGSPIRSPASPRRVPSVVITTTPSPQGNPKRFIPPTTASPLSRVDSLRVAAAEIPDIPTSKRSRPAVGNESPPTGPDRSRLIGSVLIRSPSKRDAAARAKQRLHSEVMPDLLNFQQEMKTKARAKGKQRAYDRIPDEQIPGHEHVRRHNRGSAEDDILSSSEKEEEEIGPKKRRVSGGGTKTARASGEKEEPIHRAKVKRRRTSSVSQRPSDDDESGKEVQDLISISKNKGKTSARGRNGETDVPARNIRVMTTQVILTDDTIKALTKLGVKVTTKPSECTHLLAPHIVRTEKFLCALAYAPFLLSAEWATESAAAKTLLDEEDYVLHDRANEKRFGFKLDEALIRAQENKGRLFANKSFYVTPKVSVDAKLLKNVVMAGGGQFSTQTPTLRVLNANPNRCVVSCEADGSIWRPISEQHPIYTKELILTGALTQEIDWEDEGYRVPGSY